MQYTETCYTLKHVSTSVNIGGQMIGPKPAWGWHLAQTAGVDFKLYRYNMI